MKNNPLCDLYKKEPNAAECFLRKPRPNEKEPLAIKKGLAQYIYLMENIRKADIAKCPKFQSVYSGFFDLSRGYDEIFKEKYFMFMQECRDNYDGKHKNKGDGELLTLETVLIELHERATKKARGGARQNSVEVVFGTKLLSVLYPRFFPPWDSRVEKVLTSYLPCLENSGKKIPDRYKDDKETPNFDEWDRFYKRICKWYKEFVKEDVNEKKGWIKQFDQWFEKDWYEWYLENLRTKNKNMTGKTEVPAFDWFSNKPIQKWKEIRTVIEDVKVIDLILWQRGYFPFECSHNK